MHVRTEDALVLTAEEFAHLSRCADEGLDAPAGEALAVAERFHALGVLVRPEGSAPSAADFYELSLEDAPMPPASPVPAIAPLAGSGATNSPPPIPPLRPSPPTAAVAPTVPSSPEPASVPIGHAPGIPALQPTASPPRATATTGAPLINTSGPGLVDARPVGPAAAVSGASERPPAAEAPPAGTAASAAGPAPSRPPVQEPGPPSTATPTSPADIFAGSSASGLLAALEPLPASVDTVEASVADSVPAPAAPPTGPEIVPALPDALAPATVVLGETAGDAPPAEPGPALVEPLKAISPFEGSTPSTVLAALEALPAAPVGGHTIVLDGAPPPDDIATPASLTADTDAAPAPPTSDAAPLAPEAPQPMPPEPPAPPPAPPMSAESGMRALASLEPLRPPIVPPAAPPPPEAPSGKARLLAIAAVVALLGGVGLTFALRGPSASVDTPTPAPAVTAKPPEPSPPPQPDTPPAPQPAMEPPPVADGDANEAEVDAGPAPVAAPAEAPPAAQEGEWLEVKLATRGRVTMGPLTAPVTGTLKWSVKAEQLVKKGQAVGQVAGDEGAPAAVTAPNVGLALLKAADGSNVSAGDELGSIIYFEAYARALVTDAQPTTSWRCEVASASAAQRSPCKVTAVAPKGQGVQVTATVEPRWFDDAADAVLRLAPP